MSHSPHAIRWDIFCHVIDNYGDIGVCWRLARQLVAEHGASVRLWVDDLPSFQPLCPELNLKSSEQILHGVAIRHWVESFPMHPADDVADIVIEAFACELPEVYLHGMASRKTRPIWINLEYLSAEKWIEECHGLASPHPQLPLAKYFFFPGFTSNTGGLLRESGLIQRRDCWQENKAATRRHFSLPEAMQDELLVSLFCYDNPAMPALLEAWIQGETPVRCLIPEGKILMMVSSYLDCPELLKKTGTACTRGALTVHSIPFVRQEDYDLLLWSCDLNFVRGEDSLVRALWSGKPLVWHIYPQEDAAHLNKLSAFLEQYDPNAALPKLHEFWSCWNQGHARETDRNIQDVWHRYATQHAAHRTHAQAHSHQLAMHPDLARKLVDFCQSLL